MDLAGSLEYNATTWILGAGLVLLTIAVTVINTFFKQGKTVVDKNTGKVLQHPPGSWGLPMVGHLPFLDPANPYKIMDYYIEKYGPIVRQQWGSWNTVLICDHALIRKLYGSPDYSFRPPLFSFEITSHGFHGLLMCNGPLWVEQRRFALKQLKDLGVGKDNIENRIHTEIQFFFDAIRQTKGKPTDTHNPLNFATTNVIWAMIAGERLDYKDPQFKRLVDTINYGFQVGLKFDLLGFVPWTAKFFRKNSQLIYTTMQEVFAFTRNFIQEHKKTFDPNDPRDFIDHFLTEQLKQKNNPKSTFTDEQLMVIMSDFFMAGGETVATILRWALMLLAYYPEVQTKLREEINRAVDKDQEPFYDDLKQMPYCSAVINEIQRFSDLTAFGLFHSSNEDTVFEGYHIPAGSIITAYFGAGHRSPKHWAKPYEFYPEHFLTEDGQFREKNEAFLPFSTGQRKCIGMNLGKVELFCFITHTVKHFKLRMDDTKPLPSLDADPRSTVLRWPNQHQIIFEEIQL